MLLHDLIFDREARHGARPALVLGDTCLSYSQFAEQIRSAADGFAALGIAPGERIAVYMSKRIEGVISYFAASLVGAVFVPVNPLLKPAQVEHILNDCSVSILVTLSAQARSLETELAACHSIRHVVAVDDEGWKDLTNDCGERFEFPRRIDNDVAAILYTSGSTGRPKGVVLSHRNMVMGAISVAKYLENTPEDYRSFRCLLMSGSVS